MPPRFLHVGFTLALPLDPARAALIDSVISSLGGDWVRYSLTNWVLWTDQSADQVFQRLKPYLYGTEQVLVVGVDMNDRSGWLIPALWQWMDLKPREPSKTLANLLAAYIQPPPSYALNPPSNWPPRG